jgi:hypothetical protein
MAKLMCKGEGILQGVGIIKHYIGMNTRITPQEKAPVLFPLFSYTSIQCSL